MSRRRSRAFGEDLISVPISLDHDLDYVFDVFVWDFRLEEVAHAIDEHGAGAGPSRDGRKAAQP